MISWSLQRTGLAPAHAAFPGEGGVGPKKLKVLKNTSCCRVDAEGGTEQPQRQVPESTRKKKEAAKAERPKEPSGRALLAAAQAQKRLVGRAFAHTAAQGAQKRPTRHCATSRAARLG